MIRRGLDLTKPDTTANKPYWLDQSLPIAPRGRMALVTAKPNIGHVRFEANGNVLHILRVPSGQDDGRAEKRPTLLLRGANL
jgi:hypothetical protein